MKKNDRILKPIEVLELVQKQLDYLLDDLRAKGGEDVQEKS